MKIDGWGGSLIQGRVTRVDPAGFLKVSALGIEEQRVRTTIDFVDPPEAWSRLGHDYRVIVHVTVWNADDVLTVPVGALFRKGDSWAVFAVVNGRVRTVPIEVGRATAVRRSGFRPCPRRSYRPAPERPGEGRSGRRGAGRASDSIEQRAVGRSADTGQIQLISSLSVTRQALPSWRPYRGCRTDHHCRSRRLLRQGTRAGLPAWVFRRRPSRLFGVLNQRPLSSAPATRVSGLLKSGISISATNSPAIQKA